MEQKQYRYDAFISYRHLPADEAAAKKLQALLERHKAKDGKHLRVFRDQTELPTSSDLGNQIQNALENSRFLIIICTPSYQESKWCMEELSYFRKLHGGRNINILPLLLEGEPENVFPAEICRDIRQIRDAQEVIRTVTVEVEPLGADIRADSIRMQLRKLRTEYLRIAAPILGVSYHTLYQRTKRRQLITAITAVALIALTATAFSLYNYYMFSRIDAEHRSMLARESLRLATESQTALKEGDSNLAMLLAMEALPQDMTDKERPLVEEAETALRSAVYTRMAQEQFEPLQMVASIDFNTISWDIMGLFREGQVFAVTDQEYLYFYDSANGALLFSCPGNATDTHILKDGALVVHLETESFGDPAHKAAIYDVSTGKAVYERIFHPEGQSPELLLSTQNDVLYFVASKPDGAGSYTKMLLDAVNPDGTPAACQVLPSKEYLYEPVPPIQNIGAEYFDSAHDYYWISGTTKKPHATTKQGEKYQSLIESRWKEHHAGATITEDEKLLIYDSLDSNIHTIYSVALLEQGIDYALELTGSLWVDCVNQRIYSKSSNNLQVYSYDVERFRQPFIATHISPDGSRCAIGPVVYSTDDLSTPLLDILVKAHPSAGYFLTPGLDYLFVHADDDLFRLWNVSGMLVMELIPEHGKTQQATSLAVNNDGTLVAIAYEDNRVEVYSSNSEFVTSIQFTESIVHMEFEGTRLLISGTWLSRIVEVYGQTPTIEIGDGTNSPYSAGDGQYLTSDGLLLCAGEYFNGALDAIYDLQTGECVFRELCYYQYDEESGILLYIPADPRFPGNPTLHAAKRDGSGLFHDIYTIKTQGFDMMLPMLPCSTDGRYFLLLDASCCQVYELSTGKLDFTIYFKNEQDRNSLQYCFTLKNNVLYDLRFYPGAPISAYPILDTGTLLEQAKTYLTSKLTLRVLSGAEKEQYFIEKQK